MSDSFIPAVHWEAVVHFFVAISVSNKREKGVRSESQTVFAK